MFPDFGADAVGPKLANTIPIVEHYVRDFLIKRFGQRIAEDIKPLEIQKWLKSLNRTGGLAWTTIAKLRGPMHRIYKIGIRHEHVAKSPVLYVETRSKSSCAMSEYVGRDTLSRQGRTSCAHLPRIWRAEIALHPR
jgi:hypothetical protein